MKKLPIGIQSFADLRSKDYLYVDKTEPIHEIITSGKAYFLSRPRRFGKSLLVSTLDAIFRGQKDLFEGLYIYDKIDWKVVHPVIRLDFGKLAFKTTEELTLSLSTFIEETAKQYQLSLSDAPLAYRLGELIEKLHASTGQQVAVLVDEYDKPITDHLTNTAIATTNRIALHDFYQVLKAADEHLCLVFLTGVSKFSGISIFSALNNLNDITLDDKYASICGYTQTELESYFTEYIDEVAQYVSMSREVLLETIRTWYNGYSWDGKTRVYNPFSTLLFFNKKRFANYWFSTGTPTFLIELLKERNQIEAVLEPVLANESSFDSFDPDSIGELPLLFQTGYLTVKQRELICGQAQYTLGVPNSEVNNALLEHLLSAYSQYPADRLQPLIFKMQRQVQEMDAAGLEQNLRMLFAYIPNILHVKSEAYYHSLLLLWMKMLGFDIQGEVMTDIGRIDAVWHQSGLTVIAEVKYHAEKDTDSLLNDAMTQIRDRRYYERYSDRKVLLMAVAFTGKEVKCSMETVSQNQ
jgi:hypothetical protein